MPRILLRIWKGLAPATPAWIKGFPAKVVETVAQGEIPRGTNPDVADIDAAMARNRQTVVGRGTRRAWLKAHR